MIDHFELMIRPLPMINFELIDKRFDDERQNFSSQLRFGTLNKNAVASIESANSAVIGKHVFDS